MGAAGPADKCGRVGHRTDRDAQRGSKLQPSNCTVSPIAGSTPRMNLRVLRPAPSSMAVGVQALRTERVVPSEGREVADGFAEILRARLARIGWLGQTLFASKGKQRVSAHRAACRRKHCSGTS